MEHTTKMARGIGAGEFFKHTVYSARTSQPLTNALGIKSSVAKSHTDMRRDPRMTVGNRLVIRVRGTLRYQGVDEQGHAVWG